MNEKLKPCPFCGGNNIIIAEVLETLYCDDCGCELAEDFGGTWNTRPIEDALTARIAELEKDNDEFRQLIHDWIIILTPDDGYVPDSECNDVATPIDVALRKRIAKLEAENVGLKERVAMLDVTAVFKSLGEMGYIEQTNKLHTRIAELEGLVDELIEAGESMSLAVECENQIEANAYYSWKELVKDWKEREE